MTMNVSKAQVDRLGERLRKGDISDDDLRFLDLYRRSFSEVYEFVVGAIREQLSLEPTGRPAKSTTSISDKLRRESIRLTQIQDIAGCRLIVPDIAQQELVVQSLKSFFEDTTIIDRREQPSHGYRAVHVVVKYRGKLIEIQVRTALQQLWAELSEKFSDVVSPAIKYGGGDESIQKLLTTLSSLINAEESIETKLAGRAARLASQDSLSDNEKQKIIDTQEALDSLRQAVSEYVHTYIELVEKLEGEGDDISD